MKKLMLGLMTAFAVTAFAAPSVKINKVETTSPWESDKGKIMVDYSLAGIYAANEYEVVFEVTAGGRTASVTNDATTLKEGLQPQKAIDTATLFGTEVVAKNANVKISLVKVELGCVQLWKDGPYFARCNVGATKPEEYGYYFWWGDTVGYKFEGGEWVSVKDAAQTIQFVPDDTTAGQTYNKDADTLKSEGWTDDSDNLVVSDDAAKNHDAARAHLGAPWRMMTDAEMQKLSDTQYCTSVWTNNYNDTGINGRLVKGNTEGYKDKSIFLPAAGYGFGCNLYFGGSDGWYWSSTPDSNGPNYAWGLRVYANVFSRKSDYRCYGYPVRPVRESAEESSGGGETVVATADADFWLGPGCKSCPWTVGDDVTAYITGEELDIEGTGGMYDFASAEAVPWAAFVDDVTAVTIAQGVTKVGANSWAEMDDAVEINGETIAKRQMIAAGFATPTEPSGAVSGAEPETVRIVDGKVLLGVSVCTNGDVTAATEDWQKAAIEKAEVVDGEAILTVPATAEKGFMLLKSKPTGQ